MRLPNPWQVLARTDLILMRAPIPEWGRYYDAERMIVVRTGLLLVQEREALWHELVHAKRRDTVCDLSSKAHESVERQAARWAMPTAALLEAWRGDPCDAEVADRLKTTERMLGVRMGALHPAERGRLASIAALREGAA